MKTSVRLIFGLALSLSAHAKTKTAKPVATPRKPSAEAYCARPRTLAVRPPRNGVWITTVDSTFFNSRAHIARELEQLKRIGVNEVHVVAWIKGHALFRAPIAPQFLGSAPYQDPQWAGRDLLAETIAEAHARGIRVNAWLEGAFRIPYEMNVFKTHPTWAMESSNDKKFYEIHEDNEVRRIAFLNPFVPEVQSFLSQLVETLVRNYDVDGVQIDDNFSLPPEWGYDKLTQNLYRPQAARVSFTSWRTRQLTYLVKQLNAVVHKVARERNRQVEFQVAPQPYKWGLDNLLQDWVEWLRWGYIDVLLPQIYRDSMESLTNELAAEEIVAASRCIPVVPGLLVGLKGAPVSSDMIASQILKTRASPGFDGTSLFFSASLLTWHSEDLQTRLAKIREALLKPLVSP